MGPQHLRLSVFRKKSQLFGSLLKNTRLGVAIAPQRRSTAGRGAVLLPNLDVHRIFRNGYTVAEEVERQPAIFVDDRRTQRSGSVLAGTDEDAAWRRVERELFDEDVARCRVERFVRGSEVHDDTLPRRNERHLGSYLHAEALRTRTGYRSSRQSDQARRGENGEGLAEHGVPPCGGDERYMSGCSGLTCVSPEGFPL